PAPATRIEGTTLYLRRSFTLGGVPRRVAVRAFGRGDVDVYLNGKLARGMNTRGPRNEDIAVTIQPVSPAAGIELRTGENVVAVMAKVKSGRVYVDVGLVELR
ncbi:MAG: hypothetical protein GY953_57680, partial [bacterium]|nr:hypothetical protein [bacterium]